MKKWIKEINDYMDMEHLVQWLNDRTKEYDEGTPTVSDKEWDSMFFALVEMETEQGIVLPNSPTQKVNWEVVSELEKVTHNHPMLSLDKTKDEDEFINYFSKIDAQKDVIGMLKLDGLTCSLRYRDGHLVGAETRGNGEVGEDILHNAKINASIPLHIPYREDLIVDGEIICDYKSFEPYDEKNGGKYKNPRNFASGKIRSLDSKDSCPQDLTFVVWNVILGFNEEKSFHRRLNQVEKLGFTITPYVTSLDWDWQEFLKNKAKELNYPIDGLVGRFDDIDFGKSLGQTGHHIKAAYAFKFYDEEYETRLKYIEWSMGRTGILTPIAVFDPIDADGTVIERASLHNYSIMKEIMGDCCYCGQKMIVYKANMIIPQVKSAVKMSYGDVISNCGVTCDGFSGDYGLLCPVCEGATSIAESESGVLNVVCDNPQCEGKLINRLDHFCGKKGLDIKGLSKMTLEKLIDWGWVGNIREIFSLSNFRAEWIKKPGFGVKSVDNILNAIENSKNTKFANVISAFGIPLIGSTIAKDLTNKFKTYADFRKAIEDDFDFSEFDGYGYEMNKALHNFDYAEMDDVVWNCLNLEYEEEKEIVENSITGKIFAITGKSKFGGRPKVKELIQSYGGHVGDHVTAKTNYLLCNKPENTSKYNNAQKFGTIIITDEDLEKMING